MSDELDPDEVPTIAGPDGAAIGHVDTPEFIGPYRLLKPLGEGGMGQVFAAEQKEPIRRKVALKIIKPGMDTKEVLARFEAERQAVALMDHTNIARVYDAGTTEDGRPYFVMELVEGKPLTEFCDEKKLPLKERLELFRQVCHAVQHAHQKGIIHRDLKPSNILITTDSGKEDRPVPKIIDFGVAKALGPGLTEQTLFTVAGQIIGTPQYMSPEQAQFDASDIDTRSDIYSLGVLLYELLTGRTPVEMAELKKAGIDEMLRTIREEEAPKPSTRLHSLEDQTQTSIAEVRQLPPSKLTQTLRGDLDWIVMKALEKERSRRYETANAFAADIQRYLLDEPVEASPPSASYRLKKFARRNRGVLAAGAIIAFVVLASIPAISWQAVRATNAERLANERLRESEESRKQAQAIAGFLGNVFMQSSPEKGGLNLTIVEALDEAVGKLNRDLSSDEVLWSQIASVLLEIFSGHNDYEKVIELGEALVEKQSLHLGNRHSDTIDSKLRLAHAYNKSKRFGEAVPILEEVIAASREVNGLEHPSTIEGMNQLVANLYWSGREDEALTLNEELLELQQRVHGENSMQVASTREMMSLTLFKDGRFDEALALREELLEIALANWPEHPRALGIMSEVAESYVQAGRFEEASELLEEVWQGRRQRLGPAHYQTLQSMEQLARCFDAAGQLDKALEVDESRVAACLEHLGSDHSSTLDAMTRLASSYETSGRIEAALELQRDVLVRSKLVYGFNDQKVLSAMGALARMHSRLGSEKEAMAIYQERLMLARRVFGPKSREAIAAMGGVATSSENLGQSVEAIKLREEAIRLSAQSLEKEDQVRLNAMRLYARSLAKAQRFAEEVEVRKEFLVIHQRLFGEFHAETYKAMEELADSFENTGQIEDADEIRSNVRRLQAGQNDLNSASATSEWRRSIAARQEALDRLQIEGMSPESIRQHAQDYRSLAEEYRGNSYVRKSAIAYEKAASARMRLYVDGLVEGAPDIVIDLFSAAERYQTCNQIEDALDCVDTLLDLVEETDRKTYDRWPATVRGRCAYAASWMGLLNHREGRWELAEKGYRKSLELWKRPGTEWVNETPAAHLAMIQYVNLANLFVSAGNAEDPRVLKWYREAFDFFEPLAREGSLTAGAQKYFEEAKSALGKANSW